MAPSRRLPAALAAVSVLVAVAALVVLLPGGPARAASVSSLQSQVAAKQAQEQALRSGINADSAQINRYRGSIASIQARLSQVQANLDRQRARLASIQAQERVEQAKLAALEVQLRKADEALARNLVANYESDQADALTVILNAKGFADLIERIDFLRRIKQQNTEVIMSDRTARVQVIAQATRLGALEATQQKLTASIQSQVNQIDGLRIALVQRQLVYVRARDQKAGALQATSSERRNLEASLAKLQAAQAQTAAGSVGTVGTVSPGQVSSGGGFTFPLPSGSASPPGTWSQDQGVDISAAGDTPELAVGSGTIVLHGIGGFGPDAPVLHLDSPVGGQSYVYYGHAGPQGQLPIGTHVSAGQVMSSIGPGIVGISTGPHVEIGFADASGTPAPGTSGLMLSLLQGSYHG